jgi:hypothetical protein
MKAIAVERLGNDGRSTETKRTQQLNVGKLGTLRFAQRVLTALHVSVAQINLVCPRFTQFGSQVGRKNGFIAPSAVCLYDMRRITPAKNRRLIRPTLAEVWSA